MIKFDYKNKTMKKLVLLLLLSLTIILASCSGSDTYRGSWKAMNANGAKFEIVFEADSFSIKDSVGEIKKYEYDQHSVQIQNSVRTYGIRLNDGRGYQINFPIADDINTGLMNDENGNLIYTIDRKSYVTYEDIYKLK
jgi:hypothetical protein